VKPLPLIWTAVSPSAGPVAGLMDETIGWTAPTDGVTVLDGPEGELAMNALLTATVNVYGVPLASPGTTTDVADGGAGTCCPPLETMV